MKNIFLVLCLMVATATLVGQENSFVIYRDSISNLQVGQTDEEGRKTGVWLEYWPSGNIKYQTSYHKGIRQGDYKSFREDGSLYGYGNYKDGNLNGWFIGLNEDWEIEVRLKWKGGVLIEQVILNKEAKPTGTTEEIGGKKFVWLFGELKEVKE